MSQAVDRSRLMFLKAAFAGAALSAFLILGLAHTRAFEWLEDGTYDARVRWSAEPSKADKSILIIDVDDASFNGLKDQLGRWPWSRRVWSAFLYYLAQGKPRAIAFDTIFGGAESEGVDRDFANRIRQAGNAVLAYSLSNAEIGFEGEDLNAARLRVLEPDSEAEVPGTLGERYVAGQTAFNVPLEILAQSAAGLGCVTSIPDGDGVNRRQALQFIAGGRVLRSLAVRTADVAAGGKAIFRRNGRVAIRGNKTGETLPVDDSGRMVMLWHGGSATYERIPAWKLIASIYPQQFPENRTYYPSSYFRDKIVIIGASAAGSMEARATPFSEVAPGFIIHATAIDNLLHRQAVRIAPRWFSTAAIFAASLLGCALVVLIASSWLNVLLVVVSGAIYCGLTYAALTRFQLWLPIVSPIVALLLSFATASLIRFATTGRELRRTRNTLDRYVSPALVSYVLDNLDNIKLDGERRELTIFFSDIRSFTTLTESSEPMELIRLLDEYLQAMTDVVFKYDGIVDKFIGDGILAYWGAFNPGKNHALLAAQAALEMMTRLEELNAKWTKEGRKPLRIGIGLNTGPVIFGNVGRGRKMEFTVIGDAVNLASRLEGLNKEFGTSIIVSEFTRKQLGPIAEVRSLGNVKVKGKTIETAIYELTGLVTVPNPAPETREEALAIPDTH